MGEVVNFPRAQFDILTSQDFTRGVRLLNLGNRNSENQRAKAKLTKEEIDKLPEDIKNHLPPTDNFWLFVSRDADRCSIMTGTRTKPPTLSVDTYLDGPLMVVLGEDQLGRVAIKYSPETIDGRKKITQLATVLLRLAGKKFS